MSTEVMYSDGSISQFYEDGYQTHDGNMALDRLRLITAIHALRTRIDLGMEITAHGSKLAVINVIEPLSGQSFHTASGRLTAKGRRQALICAEGLLEALESGAVIYKPVDTNN
jgi:hypothetical protein